MLKIGLFIFIISLSALSVSFIKWPLIYYDFNTCRAYYIVRITEYKLAIGAVTSVCDVKYPNNKDAWERFPKKAQ